MSVGRNRRRRSRAGQHSADLRFRVHAVLDRSPSTRDRSEPPHRRRRNWHDLKPRLGPLMLFVSVLAVILGASKGYAWLHQTPMLAIERIEVVGATRASEAEVLQLSGLAVGTNSLGFDPDQVAKAIMLHPWIAKAEVSHETLLSVKIEVLEHQPTILVALEHLYYADAAGRIVKRYAPGDPIDLPVVTGLSKARMADDPEGVAEDLRAAQELLVSWKRGMGAEAKRPSEVHVDLLGELSLVLAAESLTVRLGRPPYAEAIARFKRVRQALSKSGVKAERISTGSTPDDYAVAELALDGRGLNAAEGAEAKPPHASRRARE